jgi:hypothetical protein
MWITPLGISAMVRFIVGASALGAIVLGIVITAFAVAFVADFKGDDARTIDATLRVRIATLQTRINNLMLVIEELAGTLGYTAPGTYADGDLLIGDTDTDNLSVSTLIPLDGVSIDNGAGTITVGLLQPAVHTYMIHGPISSDIPAGAIRVCADLSGAGGSGACASGGAAGPGGGSGTYVYAYCVSLLGVVGPITGTVGLGGASVVGTPNADGLDGTASEVIVTTLATVHAYGGGGADSIGSGGGAGGGSNSNAVGTTAGSGSATLSNAGISGAMGGAGGSDTGPVDAISGDQASHVIAGAGGGYGDITVGGNGAALFVGGFSGGLHSSGNGGGAAGIGGAGGHGATLGSGHVGFPGQGCGAGGGGGSAGSGAGADGCVTLTYYFY